MDNQYYYVDNYNAAGYGTGNNDKHSGFGDVACIIGFSFSIVTICCDPLYFFSLVALVFSVLGVCMGTKNKGFAIAGIIIGVIAAIGQFIFDILSLGVGFFV